MEQRSILWVVLFLLFLSNCTPKPVEITCNPPYIKVGAECCLDSNSNMICDRDEIQLKDEPGPVEEEVPTCPEDCSDSDSCTKDYCSASTGFECKHDEIAPCCGNGECEEEENYYTCEAECDMSPTVKEINDKMLEVFKKRNVFLSEEKVEWDKGIVRHTHPAIRGSIIEIKDKDRFLYSVRGFKVFINDYYTEKYNDYISNAEYNINKQEFTYESEMFSDPFEDYDMEIIQHSDVFRFYEVMQGSGYTANVIAGLGIDSYLYVLCTPNMVLEVDKDPNLIWYQNFDGKSDKEIQDIVDNYILNIVQTGKRQAADLRQFCRDESGYEFKWV